MITIVNELKSLIEQVSEKIDPQHDKKAVKVAKLHKALSSALEIAVGLVDPEEPKQEEPIADDDKTEEAVAEEPKQEAVEITEVTEDMPETVNPVPEQPTTGGVSYEAWSKAFEEDRKQREEKSRACSELRWNHIHRLIGDVSTAKMLVAYQSKDNDIATHEITLMKNGALSSSICQYRSFDRVWEAWKHHSAKHKSRSKNFGKFVLRCDVWRGKDADNDVVEWHVMNKDGKMADGCVFHKDDKGNLVLCNGCLFGSLDKGNLTDWNSDTANEDLADLIFAETWHWKEA